MWNISQTETIPRHLCNARGISSMFEAREGSIGVENGTDRLLSLPDPKADETHETYEEIVLRCSD